MDESYGKGEIIMAQYCINKKRIIKLNIPKEYDEKQIQLGIPVTGDEAKRVGLKEVGDIVLPSWNFGTTCKKNACGYSYADKTKPMERRYVSTGWGYPYGNKNASMKAFDMYRECYPQIEVEAYGIELCLYENADNQQFVIVDMTDEIREKYMKEAINLMLEIYGKCYVYDGVIRVEKTIKKRRCNWEMLPPGEMPSRHIEKQAELMNQNINAYDIARLNFIETYNATMVVEGINGFNGYYAYLYEKCCVLESAFYGNATYIIPKDDWEKLSQKTKRELIDEKQLIAKINHTKKWKQSISSMFEELGIEKKD
ncbi:hypothetical protein [Eubacterium sp.]